MKIGYRELSDYISSPVQLHSVPDIMLRSGEVPHSSTSQPFDFPEDKESQVVTILRDLSGWPQGIYNMSTDGFALVGGQTLVSRAKYESGDVLLFLQETSEPDGALTPVSLSQTLGLISQRIDWERQRWSDRMAKELKRREPMRKLVENLADTHGLVLSDDEVGSLASTPIGLSTEGRSFRMFLTMDEAGSLEFRAKCYDPNGAGQSSPLSEDAWVGLLRKNLDLFRETSSAEADKYLEHSQSDVIVQQPAPPQTPENNTQSTLKERATRAVRSLLDR